MDTVAVRMPNHPVALDLIRKSGCLIAAPSANTSGRPSPTEASHVAEDLSGRIAMILDGGSVGIGIESTIIDLTESKPMVLRPGYITPQMLSEVLGEEVIIDPGIIAADDTRKPKASGMEIQNIMPKKPIWKIVSFHGQPFDEDAIAQHLYRILRECDELHVDAIYSESFQTPRIGQAIMNRLLKAAGHTVIHCD